MYIDDEKLKSWLWEIQTDDWVDILIWHGDSWDVMYPCYCQDKNVGASMLFELSELTSRGSECSAIFGGSDTEIINRQKYSSIIIKIQRKCQM